MGQLLCTPNVRDTIALRPLFASKITAWIDQHLQGVCPHMDEHDRAANRRAVRNIEGERVLTAWPTGIDEHPSLWIITEADRSVTTLFWPDEY